MKSRVTKQEVGKDESSANRPTTDKSEEKGKGDNEMSFFDEREGEADREKKCLAAGPEADQKWGKSVVPQRGRITTSFEVARPWSEDVSVPLSAMGPE